MLTLFVIFTYTILINSLEAAKILAVFPTPSISHQIVFRPFTIELAKRGHEVVVITTDPAFKEGNTPPNFTEIDVHNISYTRWEEVYKATSQGDNKLVTIMKQACEAINEIIETQFNVPEIQKLIKEEKFDLLLLEAWARPALVYSHIFNVPVIQVGSLGFTEYNIDAIGALWHPLLCPSSLNYNVYNLSKWEKLKTLWDHYQISNIFKSSEEKENAMLKRIYGVNTPTIAELSNNIDMMMLSIHPVWDTNRPVPPNVVFIWGIHEKPQKELPQDLKKYLDSSNNGVIYLSFGTNVKPSLLPKETIQMIVNVLSQLPYNVLWKWDKDELPGRTENIRIAKWLPQSDLLRHPNIKVFITQGGIQSLSETITAGVPVVGIPMLGDQWQNIDKVKYHKIGVGLDINNLEEDGFKNAVESVLQDQSYRRNIIKLRDIMTDDPLKPLERAVWWTEYVLRHGGARHLRSPIANISWTEYLELDIVFTIIFLFTVILFVFLILTYTFCQYILNIIRQSKKVKKT